MLFAKKNRRRVDVAKKTGELKATAKAWAPTALKVLGLLVVSAGLVAGGVAGWRWAHVTPRLALEVVQVRGGERVTDAEVLRLGGLALGQNLVGLDVGAVEQGLKAHPWIKAVQARRRFPHTLEVNVTEYVPVAMATLGELYLVDAEGVPFKRLVAQDQADVPLVTGLEREALATQRDEAVARLKAGLEVAEAYASSPAAKGAPVSEVALTEEGVELVTEAGERLKFGEGGVGEKLQRLARVRKELKRRSLTAQVIRLDNRRRADWVTVELMGRGTPRGALAHGQ